jgi:hypothetical protein
MMSRILRVAVLLLVVGVLVASALPLPASSVVEKSPHQPYQHRKRQSSVLPLQCALNNNYNNGNAVDKSTDDRGFYGNSDIYGLGIRLGLYFQWAAFLIANEVRRRTFPHVE